MMHRIWVIVQKEWLDNLRDYRSWMTGVFWALFGPLILGGMIMLLGRTIRESVEEKLILPVAGADYAPSLIEFIEQQNVTVVPAPTSAADVLALNPDGVFLSNGPGDPEGVPYAIALAAGGVFALGLAGLGLAQDRVGLFAAWVVIGLGMGSGLYESAFAALVRWRGRDARNSITGITLFAGFASTVGWPLSTWLEASFGWRQACFVWAGLHLLLGLPLNALLPGLGTVPLGPAIATVALVAFGVKAPGPRPKAIASRSRRRPPRRSKPQPPGGERIVHSRPTSSSVRGWPSTSPKRSSMTLRSRSDSESSTLDSCSCSSE